MITAFVLTWILAKKPQSSQAGKIKAKAELNNIDDQTCVAPAEGTVKPIEESTDRTFREKLMGDGFVLFPENGQVCSPINAVVKFIFPTRHAIGLVREDGVEMLIHMGINTVSLNGAPFEIFVEEGQNVQAGQPLARMELQQIRQAGCSEEICCLFTSPTAFSWTAQGAVAQAQPILTLGEKQ